MDVAATFEKNRRALLRMVVCWLALATLARRTLRLLHRWAQCHLAAMLLKAEAATGCLVAISASNGEGLCHTAGHCLDAARRHHTRASNSDMPDILDPDALIARLRALRALLRVLRLFISATIPQTEPSSFRLLRRAAPHSREQRCHLFAPLTVPP